MDKIKSFFEFLKLVINDKFKKYIVEKLFIGSLKGIKGFFVNFVIKKITKELINPSIDYLKRQYRKMITNIKNKKRIEEIKGAKDEDSLANEFRDLP